MKNSQLKKTNRIALILLIASFVLSFLLLAMPAYNFESTVYTKKSNNTFVGDEKYNEVRAEVNAVADEYRADGFEVKYNESVVERTNSKGEKTSMITFTLSEEFSKSALNFLESGLTSSWVMSITLLAMVVSLACAVLGSAWSLDSTQRQLTKRERGLRTASAVSALVAMFTIPVFVMMNTATLAHKLDLFVDGIVTDGKDVMFTKLDRFLLDRKSVV